MLYNIKSVLNGKSLYHGKVAHLAVLVKSVERISPKDCSLVLYDDSGILLYISTVLEIPISKNCFCFVYNAAQVLVVGRIKFK